MTKKHFEAIAANLREHLYAARGDNSETMRVWLICIDMAGIFAGANPRFDRTRFLAACKGDMKF
jgi:hypothetical protein